MADDPKHNQPLQAISCNSQEVAQAITHWREQANRQGWVAWNNGEVELLEGDAASADFLIRTIRAIQFHMPLPTE